MSPNSLLLFLNISKKVIRTQNETIRPPLKKKKYMAGKRERKSATEHVPITTDAS